MYINIKKTKHTHTHTDTHTHTHTHITAHKATLLTEKKNADNTYAIMLYIKELKKHIYSSQLIIFVISYMFMVR